MLDAVPDAPALIRDTGYDADWFRQAPRARGIRPYIPGRVGRTIPIRHHGKKLYRDRHRVEVMSYADAGSGGVRRFEVFTGAGGRRKWTREEKATIIAASYAGVESVCAVANRHGLRHTQLFTWRREMRRAAEAAGVTLPVAIAPAPEPLFVPAVIEPEPMTAMQPAPKQRRSGRTRPEAAAIELVIDGVAVKIARGANAGVIAAVIDALKLTR